MLAIYVLLVHLAPFALLPDWVQSLVSHGGAAVDLFFVLSGLVITQSLLRASGQAKPFLIARAARIFPVFLPIFALAVAVQPWSCGFERMPWLAPDNAARTICMMTWPQAWMLEIAAHVTMTHGLFPNGVLPYVWVSFLGSAWSLSAEWQFYFVALLSAGAATGRDRRLCWILLGTAAAGVLWNLATPDDWQFSRAFLPNKAHFFALGVASVAVVRREPGALGWYFLVLAAAMAVCALQGSFGKMLPPLAWTCCLLMQMRPRTIGLRIAGRLLRTRFMGYLGAISYSVYLVNEPIHKLIAVALSHVAGGNGALFSVLWLPAAIGLPVLVSAGLHTYVEAPAQRWGRLAAQRSVGAA